MPSDLNTDANSSLREYVDDRIGELDPPKEYRTRAEHDAFVAGVLAAQKVIREICKERGL